jgi:hypothetical protein
MLLGVVFSCGDPATSDPCRDELTWRIEFGDGTDRSAWIRAVGMYRAMGVNFSETETEGGDYVIRAFPGAFRDDTPLGKIYRTWVPFNGHNFTIYVDTEKAEHDFDTIALVFAHEIGHSFGWDHEPGAVQSVMNTGDDFHVYTDLTPHDKARLKSMCE